MTNYRPATAADIGRNDVEFSDREQQWSVGKLTAILGAVLPLNKPVYRANEAYGFRYARVPILPEECDKLRNTLREIEAHTGNRANNVPIEPQTSQCNEPVLTIRRKLEAGGYAEPEVAIYLDGRYYSTEWIKSGVGVLPQQVEIV